MTDQDKKAWERIANQMNKIELIKAILNSECNEKQETQEHINRKVGDCVFIRTVTFYYTGRIKKILPNFLVLEDAAWIADTGRFHDFLKSGLAKEVEPFVNDVDITIGSIIDVTSFNHELPKTQK